MFREVVCGQILGEFPAQKFRDFPRIFGILVMSPTRRSCHQLGGHVAIPALTHPFPRTLGTLYVASERFFSLPPPETMFPRRKTYQTLITCLPGLARKSRVCQNGFFPRKWGKVVEKAMVGGLGGGGVGVPKVAFRNCERANGSECSNCVEKPLSKCENTHGFPTF